MLGDKGSLWTPRAQERRIVSLAARQHGNVTRQQLLELGLGAQAIKYRQKTGRLYRVHRGVYGVGRPPQTAFERSTAAVLACGPDAALSHDAALALWGFAQQGWPSSYDVTIYGGGDRRPEGIRVHRCTTLKSRDLRIRHAIRTTSLPRTLLDCAPLMTDRTLKRAVNDALRSPHLNRAQLAELLARTRQQPGSKLLDPFVATGDGPTRSSLEDEFLVFCERFGLPLPRVNIRVGGREVDAYFEAENLIVELDGYGYHSDREAFERDRENDAEALAAGRSTVRLTTERIRNSAEKEAARLEAILSARRNSARAWRRD